ncbi:hypothetical protein F5Y17DRAFT_456695 [Xylariaceae sp. FL0594]|nr:hypothetical protein F5Y17DRAFT_456695 [Xylariaceae sp. FL0594]
MAATVDAKLLRATKFPPEFSQKVDMQKVNLQVMKKWIAGRISEILGSEDDVVIELCFNLIDGPRYPDIKSMQIQLTGFLDKDTPSFCRDLWKLCLSAQSSPQGVPKELLEAKKLELIQEKIKLRKTTAPAVRYKSVEIMSQLKPGIESDGIVASVEVEGIIGAEDAAATELSMIAVEASVVEVVQVPHRGEIATHINPVVIAMCLTDAVVTGKDSAVVVPQLTRQSKVFEPAPAPKPAEIPKAETVVRTKEKLPSITISHPKTTQIFRLTQSVKVSDPQRQSATKSLSVILIFPVTIPQSQTPAQKKRDHKRSSSRRRVASRSRASLSPKGPSPSKRRRSSSASPRARRDRSADVSENEDRLRSPKHETASVAKETKTIEQRANELKEKLLKDKIIKMRKASTSDAVGK